MNKKGGNIIDKKDIYIQLEPKIQAKPSQIIKLRDIAAVYCNDSSLKEKIRDIEVYETSSSTKNDVLSVLHIIKKIQENENDLAIKIFGKPEILIDIRGEKHTNILFQYLKIFIVCITLFLGAGLAIINFHQDVNMEDSLRTVYEIVTGEENKRPLILQIPYSLGIGIGMVTFFNHVVKKKWKKEPSPLDVEMYMYDKNIDEYVIDNTKQNKKFNSS
ncbi:stage V sporulation protein AA [Sporosalibacterium faouarense]|uniref:stage V sporulation protein AA n=1 Tax=Sporosalibacterium faouarense TaxID=516123 RepID=UPI00141C354F|nr:stage V sporulation protein AA [Sporosalibacterium faouarense]MTI49182.1 stage V sporulation protein AA [Bacillota bacterium]